MTSGTYKRKGQGVLISYTITDLPLGYLLLAATEKGVCAVRFGNDKRKLERELKREFNAAQLIQNDQHLRKWVQSLVDYLAGHKPWPLLPYDVQATAFQRRVWDWLRTIPSGTTYNYSEAAKAIGEPTAVRAVARACAANPVALVIPCHRIVPKSGGVGGYRWNSNRKRQLLKLEKMQILNYGRALFVFIWFILLICTSHPFLVASDEPAKDAAVLKQDQSEEKRQALEKAERVLRDDPSNHDALFLKGEIYESQGEYLKAIEVYEQILIFYPGKQAAQNLKVRAMMSMGAVSLAQKEIERVGGNVDPEIKRRAFGDRAMYFIQWGQPHQALQELDENVSQLDGMIEHEPEQFQSKPSDPAKRSVDVLQHLHGLEAFPVGLGSHYVRNVSDRMLALRLEQRMEEIAALYEELVQMGVPIPHWVRQTAGDAYLYLEKPKKALKLYQSVYQEKPKAHNIRMSLYHTYVELRRFREAEKILNELDQETPIQILERGIFQENWKKAEIALNRAWFFIYQDRLAEAETYLNEKIKQASFNTNFLAAQAHLYFYRGWIRRALQAFEMIRTIDPNHETANNGYCLTLHRSGNEKKAELLLKELRIKHPRNKHLKRTERAFNNAKKRTFIVDGFTRVEYPGSDEYFLSAYLDQPVNPWLKFFTNQVFRWTIQNDRTEKLRRMYYGAILQDGINWQLKGGISTNHDLEGTVGFLTEGTYAPNDYLSFRGGFESQIYDIPVRSRQAGVDAKQTQASMTYRLNENFLTTLSNSIRFYSDGNEVYNYFLNTDNSLFTRASWKLRLRSEWFASWSSKKNVLYFNPSHVFSGMLIPVLEHVWFHRYERKIVDRIFFGYGLLREKSFDAEDLWLGRYELEFNFTDTIGVLVGGGYAHRSYEGKGVDSMEGYFKIKKNF